jgi:DNA-binding response OmpR family regulator
VASLLLLTGSLQVSVEVLPALALLPHQVRVLPAEASALIDAPACDAVLVDGRHDLAKSRSLTRIIRTTGIDVPLLLVLTEGGLPVVNIDWGIDDVLLANVGPVELDTRLRLAAGRLAADTDDDPDAHVIRSGNVEVDEVTYTARLGKRTLDLTFKEFELLKHLAPAPGSGLSPASSCWRRCGATTTSAAPEPWTSTSAGCEPSSARRTRP